MTDPAIFKKNHFMPEPVETGLSARIRELLDAVSCTSSERSKAELEQLSNLPEAAAEILDTLISCLIFSVRCEERAGLLHRRILHSIEQEPDPKKAETKLDLLAFRQVRAPRALAALENISDTLRENLTAAAGKVLRGLSGTELCVVLLSDETPAWLIRAILSCKKFLDILGQAVCVPYNQIHHKNYFDSGYFADNEQKAAEIMRVIAMAEKAVNWFYNCQPEHLPPGVDPCPPDAQDFAMRKITAVIRDWPPDKLLALSVVDFFPAWLRLTAENRFHELTKSNNPDRPKRRRQRRSANTQSPGINGTAV